MFIVILVSIVVFSLIGWWSPWINLLIRFLLVPLVAGIAYEIIRLAGRFDNWLTRAISYPGLWLQRLTTAEPNDKMLEVSRLKEEVEHITRHDIKGPLAGALGLAQSLLDTLTDFCTGAEPADDITLIAVRRPTAAETS